MVLLGGIQTLTGPILGAAAFALLQDTIMREGAGYWRGTLGAVILLLVLVFPGGIVGTIEKWLPGRVVRA
jgi:branched-chain amino acid transport system permease protein